MSLTHIEKMLFSMSGEQDRSFGIVDDYAVAACASFTWKSRIQKQPMPLPPLPVTVAVPTLNEGRYFGELPVSLLADILASVQYVIAFTPNDIQATDGTKTETRAAAWWPPIDETLRIHGAAAKALRTAILATDQGEHVSIYYSDDRVEIIARDWKLTAWCV